MKQHQSGFTHSALLAFLLVALVIGAIGVTIARANNKHSQTASIAATSAKSNQAHTAGNSDPIPATKTETENTPTQTTQPSTTTSSAGTTSSPSTQTSTYTPPPLQPVDSSQIDLLFNYEFTKSPNPTNECHAHEFNPTTKPCPAGAGLIKGSNGLYVVVPSGWAFEAAGYAYAYSATSKSAAETNLNWNGKGTLPYTKLINGKTATLYDVSGSMHNP